MFARRREARDNETVPISMIDWWRQFKPGAQVVYNGNKYQAFSTNTTGGGAYYDSNSVVFACEANRLLLFSEARFQFQEMRKGRPGNLYGTDALKILEQPWAGASTGELLAQAELDVFSAGNSYWTLDPDAAASLIRFDPSKMKILTIGVYDTTTGRIFGEKLLAYAYCDHTTKSNAPPIIFEPNEIAHYKPYPDMGNRFVGRSWVSSCISDVDSDDALTEHKRMALRQGANLGYVAVLDKDVSPDDFNYFVEKFREDHERPENSGKTLFIGGGADVKTVGQTFENMAFKAVQGAGETRVAACSGVPPVIVGLSEGLSSATYSNYSQARRRLVDGTMRPLWRGFASSMASLVPAPPGSRLWYDDRDIAFLRDDIQEQAQTLTSNSSAIVSLINGGFEPDAVIDAVNANDLSRLASHHTGLTSVQLQPPLDPNAPPEPPGGGMGGPPAVPPGNGSSPAASVPATREERDYITRRVELAQRDVVKEVVNAARYAAIEQAKEPEHDPGKVDGGIAAESRDFIQGPDGKMAGSSGGGSKGGGKGGKAEKTGGKTPGTITKDGGMIVAGGKTVHIGDKVTVQGDKGHIKAFDERNGVKVKDDDTGIKAWYHPEDVSVKGGPGHTPEDLIALGLHQAVAFERASVDALSVMGTEVHTAAHAIMAAFVPGHEPRSQEREFVQGPDGKMAGSTGAGSHGGNGKGGAGKVPVSSLAAALSSPGGGFTIDPVTGNEPTTGYIVATTGIPSGVHDDSILGDEEALTGAIDSYLAENADVFGGGVMFGGWHDTDNNKVVFDAVEHFSDKESAIAAGIDRDQVGIYDVSAGDTIPTGGTGGYAKETVGARQATETGGRDDSTGTQRLRPGDRKEDARQRVDAAVRRSGVSVRDFIQGPDGKMQGSSGGGAKTGAGKAGGKPGTGQQSFGGHVTPSASSTYLGLGIADTESLAGQVESNPDRFEFLGEPGGISAGGEYRDAETGAHFYIKEGTYYPFEPDHELEAHALLENTGLMHMDVVPAGYSDEVELVAMTHAESDPEVRSVLGEGVHRPLDEASMRAMAEDAVRLQTFDQVVNNTDRHSGNYLTVTDQNGLSRLYVIDNSLIDPTGMYSNPDELYDEAEPRDALYFPFSALDFDATITSEEIAAVRTDFLDKMESNVPVIEEFAPAGEPEAIADRIAALKAGEYLMPPRVESAYSSGSSGSTPTGFSHVPTDLWRS
jgi:hypothetical protein